MSIHCNLIRNALALWVGCSLLFAEAAVSDDRKTNESVMVFAAASMTNVVADITEIYNKTTSGHAITSFAASSTLAKQIENGAPADIYISADQKWMNYLAMKNKIEPSTRFDLAGNQIVLISHIKKEVDTVTLSSGFDLKGLLKSGRLAMGDPAHVPAGRYAKEALECLDIWPKIQDRIAPSATVRAALLLVERNEAPMGIVYKTDTALSRQVTIVGTFPTDCQPDITYPAAIIKGRKSIAAKAFLEFLKTDQAAGILTNAGFTVK